MSEVRPTGYTLVEGLESVGKGWATLIHVLFVSKPTHVEIVQVKEKFGQLRVYIDPSSDAFANIAAAVEKVSELICEDCALPGTMTTDRGWMLTLCPVCKQERGRT